MPTENRIYLDPEKRLGLDLYAKVFGTVTVPHSTATIDGSEVGNGHYQFPGLDTDLAYTIYEEQVAGTKAATDDWLAVLVADFSARAASSAAVAASQTIPASSRAALGLSAANLDTQLAAIAAKTLLIPSGSVQLPTAYDPRKRRLSLTQRDDYDHTSRTHIDMLVHIAAGINAATATVQFAMTHQTTGQTFSLALSLVDVGGSYYVRFQATSADMDIAPGLYDTQAVIVEAINSRRNTVVRGIADVAPARVPPSVPLPAP